MMTRQAALTILDTASTMDKDEQDVFSGILQGFIDEGVEINLNVVFSVANNMKALTIIQRLIGSSLLIILNGKLRQL